MAKLKCLACGHDNKVGDDLCASCSSSLNLQLCTACEAINADSAQRCHGCGRSLEQLAEVIVLDGAAVREAPARASALPSTWVISDELRAPRRTAWKVAAWTLPALAAAGLGYQLYGTTPARAVAQPTPVLASTPAPEPRVVVETAPPVVTTEPPAPPAEPKRARAAPAAAPAPAFEPKHAHIAVTHTRTGQPEVAAPVVTVKAAAAPLVSAGEPAPTPGRRVPPVTHTRAEVTPAADVLPAAAAGGASAPAACAPEVSALGLCRR